MANNGKALTNVAFRSKMLALIDKLKNQDKTALVRHVDDFEALNKDTFEAGMNAVIEAIPEGGGGGGGTGDGGYVVTFGIDVENEGAVTCDKTIEDIIAHADKHIVGRLVVENFSMDGVPLTIDLYCDNLKFDYQKLNSDDPEVAPLIPTYTYLGFSGDAFITAVLTGESAPRGNTPLEDNELQYYKTCISFYYLFADENPHWGMNISDIGGDEYTPAYHISDMPEDQFYSNNGDQIKLIVTSTSADESSVANSNAFWEFSYQNPVSKFSEGGKTALFSPTTAFANGVQATMYSKPAQFNVHVYLGDLQPSRNDVFGVFTVSKFAPYVKNEYGGPAGGEILMHMDEDDASNNKIIRHIIHVRYDSSGTGGEYFKTIYKQVEIPYTIHSY